jgi:predicted AAA+ superfamily ATPase
MTLIQEDTARRLSKTLGLYKAEWLNEAIFSLFNEPSYFEELRTHRPCVLIGGRGTGKTTVLRGLSYEGQ